MKGSVLSYVFDESQLTKQQINGYYFDEEWHHLKLQSRTSSSIAPIPAGRKTEAGCPIGVH